MLLRSNSYDESLFDAAFKVERAHTTPQSEKDFNSLLQPGRFTLPEQVELLHHAAILLREQGRVEALATDKSFCQREFIWAALYPHLRKAGYLLPHRYAPSGHVVGEKPHGPFEGPLDFHCRTFSARCAKTGKKVILKITCSRPGSPFARELEILRLLNAEPLRSHPDNAAVRLLDVVAFPRVQGQPRAADLHVLVMPALHEFSLSECAINDYALHLMKQSFRAVALLHSIGICHRDIGARNFMMAPTERGPYQLQLMNFDVSQQFDLSKGAPSVQFYEGQLPPPEVEEDHDAQYDPFKAEIFSLGMTCKMELLNETLPAAAALLDRMTHRDPAQRPSAAQCVGELEVALSGVGIMMQCGPTRSLVTALKMLLFYPEERDVRESVRYAAGYVRAVSHCVAHWAWEWLL